MFPVDSALLRDSTLQSWQWLGDLLRGLRKQWRWSQGAVCVLQCGESTWPQLWLQCQCFGLKINTRYPAMMSLSCMHMYMLLIWRIDTMSWLIVWEKKGSGCFPCDRAPARFLSSHMFRGCKGNLITVHHSEGSLTIVCKLKKLNKTKKKTLITYTVETPYTVISHTVIIIYYI